MRRYFAAWACQDQGTVESMTAEGFHFTSPLDNRIDRKTFFERCWPNSAAMSAFDLQRVIAHGDEVIVTYQLTLKDGRRLRNTEVIKVHSGQIVDVEVYFGWDLPHQAPVGGFLSGGG